MKLEYDEAKKRIVIDGEGVDIEVGDKKILVSTVETKSDAKELKFQPVEIDDVLVNVVMSSDVTYPVRISILGGATHGENLEEEIVPGEILTVIKTRALAKALNDAADFVEGRGAIDES
jgi:hypothetical protein